MCSSIFCTGGVSGTYQYYAGHAQFLPGSMNAGGSVLKSCMQVVTHATPAAV